MTIIVLSLLDGLWIDVNESNGARLNLLNHWDVATDTS